MREFISLKPDEIPDDFDVDIHTEEPIVKIEESKERIVISYIFPGFYSFDDIREVSGKKITFKQINIKKAGFLAESGKPLLPSFGRYVQIPYDCDFEVTVVRSDPIQFDDVLVLPSQEKLVDAENQKQEFEYEQDFYSKEDLYPSNLVEVTGPFELDAYNTLLVHVRPLQYNPVKKKLHGFGNFTITIDFSSKKDTAEDYSYLVPELNKEAFGNLLLNPKRRIEERLAIGPVRVAIPFKPRGPEFLIIYHEDFKKASKKLAKWKNMRGLRTEIVSINIVGNEVDKIKKYIRNIRSIPFNRLRYVLLFGDVDMIVSETITGGAYGSNVTDFYYSTQKNPTPDDPNDFVLPWISIGRIPVRTEKEGMTVVNQIIKYEKNPSCDPEYYRRMAFAAYFQDDNGDGRADRAYMKTMEDIREHMITLGFDVERIYVSNNLNPQKYVDGTLIPDDVKNSIVSSDEATDMLISTTSEGQLITGHRDHGSSNGWSHPSFITDHLDSIVSEYSSIFYSVNCLTGKFDLTAPTESFAEKLLGKKGGAPSLIAATRVSHTWLNNDLMKGLFDAMWAGVLPTFPGSTASYPVRHCRLGDILCYGKSYLPIALSGSEYYIKDHLEIYHVNGDPTIELWRAYPIVIRLEVKVIEKNLHILLSSCPTGSVVTIWYKNTLLKRIEPSSPHIKLPLGKIPLNPLSPKESLISICFWATGHRFRNVKVKISY